MWYGINKRWRSIERLIARRLTDIRRDDQGRGAISLILFIIQSSIHIDMSLRLALPRQGLRPCRSFGLARCISTTAPRREPVTGTLSNIAHKVKEAVKDAATHTEQYEGVQEEGLRMLMFGKPGSGKVRPIHESNLHMPSLRSCSLANV